MKRLLIASLVVCCVLVSRIRPAAAHCEVPCGIYDDQRRFEQMLEDHQTIAKAMTAIRDLTAKRNEGAEPLSANQLIRWVATKEAHATSTQDIIARYFMTQRIKPDADGYVKKLTAAHAVMIAAMKCKQTVDAANADALRAAILDFYRAYEGKEPQLGK
jgi:nickel superoxide dismutase